MSTLTSDHVAVIETGEWSWALGHVFVVEIGVIMAIRTCFYLGISKSALAPGHDPVKLVNRLKDRVMFL